MALNQETKRKTPTHTHTNIYIYIYICVYIYYHVVPLARISLTLSRHFSLSFIASGRSLGLHPVSSYSCCMYVRAGRPAFARPYVGVYIYIYTSLSIYVFFSSTFFLSIPIYIRLNFFV